MAHNDIVAALSSLRPGAAWSLTGDDQADLVWLDAVHPRPTEAEIAAEAERLAAMREQLPTPTQKLAASGLTVAELKALLALPT